MYPTHNQENLPHRQLVTLSQRLPRQACIRSVVWQTDAQVFWVCWLARFFSRFVAVIENMKHLVGFIVEEDVSVLAHEAVGMK